VSHEAPPTIAQVFAIAIALCARVGEPFPETRARASALIAELERELANQKHERAPIVRAPVGVRGGLD